MGASPLGGMPSGCARANPLEINSYSQWSPLFPAFGTRWICWTCPSSYGEKTRPGRCPEPELIALRPLMINQAREVFCQGRFPASLIYVLIVSPWPAVPSTLMPLPSRTALLWKPTVLNIIFWLSLQFSFGDSSEQTAAKCSATCVESFVPCRSWLRSSSI